MILVLAVLLSLAIGILRGGRLEHLATLPLRWGGVVLLAFLSQAYFIYASPVQRTSGEVGAQDVVLIGTALLVLAVTWANRHLRGVILLGCGLCLNLLVMVANGGLMPITPEALRALGHERAVVVVEPGAKVDDSKDVVLPREKTRLWFLSDIFVLSRPFPLPSAFSIGDVIIAAGAFVVLQDGLLARHRDQQRWNKPQSNIRTRQKAREGGSNNGERRSG